MRLNLVFFMLLIAAIFVSCKKTTNVDVSLSNSGTLSYKLTDDVGKGIPNVKLSLYDRFDGHSNYSVIIDQRLTDQNGIVDFGELNPRTYSVGIDSMKVKNVTYTFQEFIQVVSGKSKSRDLKVTDLTGTLKVSIKSSNTNQPLKNVGVLIIPQAKYNYDGNTAKYLSIADFKGVTNEAGQATFQIPANIETIVYVYNVGSSKMYKYSFTNVERGDVVFSSTTIND